MAMKISSRIIAKFLTLCGISLICTACYAAPRADYHTQCADDSEVVAGAGASSEDTSVTLTEITDTADEE